MEKKIVMIVEAMLGGIRQHVCDIVENLDKKRYKVYVIYSDLRADDAFRIGKSELENHAKLICCNEMKRTLGKEDFLAYRKIVEIIKEIQPDIVHCHSSKAGGIGRIAAKRCGVPLIVYTPNAYAFQAPDTSMVKRVLYVCVESVLARYATSITINVSKGEMQAARDYHIDKPGKFTLIYNGISQINLKEKVQLRQELGFDENKYYIGVTARCAEQKDPFTFLKIAKKVIEKSHNIEFVYIGDGELQDRMKRWIKEKKMEQKIHMLGFRTDAAEIVGALDLYLSTALYEGLPYSMIEAMRAGVPILATDVVGNNELVFEGKNGRLFPVGDVERAYRLIMRQYDKNEIKPQNVKDTFIEKFSLDNMIKQLNQVYAGQRGKLY